MSRRAQRIVAFLSVALLAAPFQAISRDVYAVAVWTVIGVFFLLLLLSRDRPAPPAKPDPHGERLARLIASGQPEAEVAAAASRAWNETLAEPAWGSDWMAAHRSGFDGAAETAQIIDSALQIMAGRDAAGRPADGVARSHWSRQHEELDAAALRLGERADDLIRYRDRVGELSRAVHHLDELQRMERSALAVDEIVASTSFGYGEHKRRMTNLADEIAGVRMGIEDLVELLNRG